MNNFGSLLCDDRSKARRASILLTQHLFEIIYKVSAYISIHTWLSVVSVGPVDILNKLKTGKYALFIDWSASLNANLCNFLSIFHEIHIFKYYYITMPI